KDWLRRVARAARAARQVVTPSAYSKAQAVARLGVPADKVTVIGWAPDARMAPVTNPAEFDRVRAKYGLRSGEAYGFGFGASDERLRQEVRERGTERMKAFTWDAAAEMRAGFLDTVASGGVYPRRAAGRRG